MRVLIPARLTSDVSPSSIVHVVLQSLLALLRRCCPVTSCSFSASQKKLLILFATLCYILCFLLSYRLLYFRVHLPTHFSFFPPCTSKWLCGRELRKHILLFLSSKNQVVSLLSGQQGFSPKVAKEQCSLANSEKLKAHLLQMQTELNNSKQEYEEFKELTR